MALFTSYGLRKKEKRIKKKKNVEIQGQKGRGIFGRHLPGRTAPENL